MQCAGVVIAIVYVRDFTVKSPRSPHTPASSTILSRGRSHPLEISGLFAVAVFSKSAADSVGPVRISSLTHSRYIRHCDLVLVIVTPISVYLTPSAPKVSYVIGGSQDTVIWAVTQTVWGRIECS